MPNPAIAALICVSLIILCQRTNSILRRLRQPYLGKPKPEDILPIGAKIAAESQESLRARLLTIGASCHSERSEESLKQLARHFAEIILTNEGLSVTNYALARSN
jgi:hypothetical protein